MLNYLNKNLNDIICLQEVSVPVSSKEEYLSNNNNSNNNDKLYEENIKPFVFENYKVSNYSFKLSPIHYDYPNENIKNYKDKRFLTDTGVLTH